MLELKVLNDGKQITLKFEHSLLSISKWESKTKKAFLASGQKTPTELVDYFEEMLVSPSNRELVYLLDPDQMDEVTNYINDSRTASSIPEVETKAFGQGEVITSELIYYWMSALQIPFDAEKWHISRLLMLVRIANFKQSPPEKQSKATMLAKWKEINDKRKAMYNTTG